MLILLVNNKPDERGVFAEALRRVDTTIMLETVEDGADAFKYLIQNPHRKPELIVVDETGFRFVQKLRGRNEYTDIPVTVYTTSTNPDDIDASIAFGASFFPKPTSYFALVKLLKKRLEKVSIEMKPNKIAASSAIP